MSKAVKTEQAVETEVATPVLDHESLSITENKNGWNLVRIKYNPVTKEVGKLEFLETSKDWSDIINSFETRVEEKIMAQ